MRTTALETVEEMGRRPFTIEQGRPLHDQVLEEIERMILSGELRPGDPLREQALADGWGVSRSPIREACRVLQEAGLVDIVRNRGVFVRKVSFRDVLHLFDIRGALWRLSAMEATEYLNQRHLKHLEGMINRIDEVIARGDADGYLTLNYQFHDAIVVISGNRPLAKLQRALFLQARLFRRQALSADTDMKQRNADHRHLLEAMRRGDAEEAGRISEAHVRRSKQRFIESVGATVDPIADVFDKEPE